MKVEYDSSGYPVRANKPDYESRCYTVEDLANILFISRSAVYNLLKEHQFKWFRIGKGCYRIQKKSFDEWFENNCD